MSRRQLNLSGVMPPICTPFDAGGELCLEDLGRNLKKWSEVAFSGYVVLGSNGEFPYLSDEEKVELLRFARQSVPKQEKLLIAGAGCESTKGTVNLCEKFGALAVDAAMVYTPCFYKGRMTSEALSAHFKTVADRSPIPVILYSVPGNTGIDLPTDVIIPLADHPNIVGLKDSGGNVAKLAYVVHETKGKDFQVLAGSAGYLMPAIQAGCVGAISAFANCCGGATVELYNLLLAGETDAARELQGRIVAPNLAVTAKYGVPALKHMMDKLGYVGGSVRSPLLPLNETEAAEVEGTFRKHGFF